jgi:HD-GYP domain-containing protein (c-di-GMP phosphodiesterase class II)
MEFNIRGFLISASFVLDFIEMDILKSVSNHGLRVAYIALKIGKSYNLSDEEKFDLLVFSLLHDIGAVENLKAVNKAKLEKAIEHCTIGEEIIQKFPFHKSYKNILKYHHESYDGSGFFGKKGDEIPLFSQIIAISDFFELNYKENDKKELLQLIESKEEIQFSKDLTNRLISLTKHLGFWLDIKDAFVLNAIENLEMNSIKKYGYEDIKKVTRMFSKIIDSKSEFTKNHSSGLTKKLIAMGEFYEFDDKKNDKLSIAGNLHDIGKLAISNRLLDRNGKLTAKEFETVRKHVYYTRKVLEPLDGFGQIVNWAANHHERNDGSGYPFGLKREEMDFESRLLAVLDVYQALREVRPYRGSLSHEKSMDILMGMAKNNKFDLDIVMDINRVFH